MCPCRLSRGFPTFRVLALGGRLFWHKRRERVKGHLLPLLARQAHDHGAKHRRDFNSERTILDPHPPFLRAHTLTLDYEIRVDATVDPQLSGQSTLVARMLSDLEPAISAHSSGICIYRR